MANNKKETEILIGANTTGAVASLGDLRKAAVADLEKISDAAKKESKEISNAFQKMGIRTDADINESTANAVRHYKKIKESGKSSAREIRVAHDAMTRRIKQNNAEMLGSTKKLTKAGALLGTAFAPIVAIFAAIRAGTTVLTESIRFESALLDLQKVLSDTDGDVKQFIGRVDELAKKFGVSAVDVLQGVAIFKQSGFEINEAFKLQAATLELVINGQLEAADAARLLKETLKGFKFEASEAVRITDVLNEISNKYGTNLFELATAMAKISPIAKKANLSFEETAALITPVIEVFGSGSEAAQAFKTGLLRLAIETPPVTAKLKEMGIAQREGPNKEFRSAKDIIDDVATSFLTMKETAKLNTAGILAGKLQAGKMSEVFDGLALSTEILGVAMNAAGSSAKEAAIQLSSSQTRVDRAGVAFRKTARIIGDGLKPAFNDLLDVMIAALPVVSKVFNALRKGSLEAQRGFFVGVKAINGFLLKLGLAKDQSIAYADAIKTLDEDIENLARSQKRTNEQNDQAITKNKQLTESEKAIQAELQKKSDALKRNIELLKENAIVAAKSASEALSSLEKQSGSQTKLTNEIKLGIKQHKALLAILRREVDAAEDFANEIDGIIKDAEIAIAQSGMGEVAKLIDNLDRTFNEFNTAAKTAMAEGNEELARTLTREAAKAAKEILETQANQIELQVAGKQTAGLDEAAIKAKEILLATKEFANVMKVDAKEAVDPVAARLKDMVTNLGLSESKLKSIDIEIKETQKLVDTLNAELGKDITKNVTVVTTNVQGLAEGGQPVNLAGGGKVPGSGTGDKIHAMLDPREVVINPKAVSAFSLPAALAFNNRDLSGLLANLPLSTDRITKMQEGGEAQAAFNAQQGGQQSTQAPSETIRIELGSGQNTLSTMAQKSEAETFVKQIKQMNANQGRYNTRY